MLERKHEISKPKRELSRLLAKQRPNDDFNIICAPGLHHLRGKVVEGSAQGGSARGGGVHTPAEISNLDIALRKNVDETVRQRCTNANDVRHQ